MRYHDAYPQDKIRAAPHPLAGSYDGHTSMMVFLKGVKVWKDIRKCFINHMTTINRFVG